MDLLAIEDLGTRHLPPTAAADLLEVFTRCHKRGAIILTTNRPLEDWGRVLGDTAVAGAILNRFPTAGKELPHVGPPAARWEPALTGLDEGDQVSYL